jgi:hypothetical protein
VVAGEHEAVPLRAEPDQQEPQQRRPAEVERPGPVLAGRAGGHRVGVDLLGPGRVDLAPGQPDAAQHHLDRSVLPGREGDPQVGVPVQHRLRGTPHGLGVERPGQLDGELHGVHVGRRPVVPAVEQQPFLQWRQGPDILDPRLHGDHPSARSSAWNSA